MFVCAPSMIEVEEEIYHVMNCTTLPDSSMANNTSPMSPSVTYTSVNYCLYSCLCHAKVCITVKSM